MTIKHLWSVFLICFLPFLISAKDNSEDIPVTSHYFRINQFDKSWNTNKVNIREINGVFLAEFTTREDQSSKLIVRKLEKTITVYGAFNVEEIKIRRNGP